MLGSLFNAAVEVMISGERSFWNLMLTLLMMIEFLCKLML
jgi:hypothetical protein